MCRTSIGSPGLTALRSGTASQVEQGSTMLAVSSAYMMGQSGVRLHLQRQVSSPSLGFRSGGICGRGLLLQLSRVGFQL